MPYKMCECRNFSYIKFLLLITKLQLYEITHTKYFLIQCYYFAWNCLLIFIVLYFFPMPLICLLINWLFFLFLIFELIPCLTISSFFDELVLLQTLALLAQSLALLKLVLKTIIKITVTDD